MLNLQCDKIFKKTLIDFMNGTGIPVSVKDYSKSKSDICILRSDDGIPFGYKPESSYIILNSDNMELFNKIGNVNSRIITCGLSTRSTVTFSSVSDRKGVVCIQRQIEGYGEKISAPTEIPFEVFGKFVDEVSILILITTALICGADISKIIKIHI